MGSTSKPLDDSWRGWLRLNRQRGCDLNTLFLRAQAEGFDPAAIAVELGGFIPADPEPSAIRPSPPAEVSLWQRLARAPLTDPEHRPRAWRLDTSLAQVYEIPDLLPAKQCRQLIRAIDTSLNPSTVTRGPQDYRTSRTCYLNQALPELSAELDRLLAALIGVDPAASEPLQGQRYDQGQYFKAHTDWFAPGTQEYAEHTNPGGQRTWTVMMYLNRVPAGGETRFVQIGRDFQPQPGLALAWNNLLPDGLPNPATLHEALPVQKGRKYVITKWFRAEPGRNGPRLC